jgi:hypothetical protein
MRNYAQRLIAYEAKQNQSFGIDHPAAFGVCGKLREPLASLSGINGFRSLLSRALALAGHEVRWLRAVHVNADGSLECPAEMSELDKKEISDGENALVTQLLGLLVTFIGEPLTLSLVREVWPGAPFNVTASKKKESNEIT